nr:serine/arginine repetitive matrix protein 2-like isoform X3 [Halyomorpha halys]
MTEVTKSSDEILTELFDSFKAEASVDVSDNSVTPKSPKDEPSRSKKKRKKDKKHKSDEKDKHRKKKKCKRHKKKESSNPSDKSSRPKKKKKRKFSSDSFDSEVEAKQNTKIVNVESCNKENNLPEEKKISEVNVSHLSSVVNNFTIACDTSSIPLPPTIGDSILTPKVAQEVPEVKKPQVSEVFEKHAENVGKPPKKLFLQGLDKPKMSIKIGNLKNSQVLEAAEEAKIKADKYEEGEITDETSEESTKLLIKAEMETTSENGNIDGKIQKLYSEQKKYRTRTKSSDSSNINSSISTGDIKSDDHKCAMSEGSNGVQVSEENFSVSETLEKVNKKSNENESSLKNTFDNKNQLKLKKLRQLRERKLDHSSSEDEYNNATKCTKEDSKKAVNKSKRRSNKLKSTTDSDRSSSSSESSSSFERAKSSKSMDETTALKDIKTSSKLAVNSVSRKNFSPKTKHRKSKSRDRSASVDKYSTLKAKKTRSSSRSKLRKSRSVSKSRIRNSRSQSRYFNQKSRSTSRSRQRKSLSRSRERKSRSRERKSRSVSYSRSRLRRSRSRSRVRRSRTPKKYYGRKSRSPSKHKTSPSPFRVKTKKSRSPSRTKTRKSSSPSVSRGRRSRSLSRLTKRKSRSRGRKSSRSPSKLFSSKVMTRRSRSNIRSLSRNRSASKSGVSRFENRRSRSKNKRSSKRRSRSRDSQSRSKQSDVKNLKGNKERNARSSSSKHSCSKLSDLGSDRSESDSKYKGSKKKKSKEKKSNSKKHKSKHKDINSRLLALSSTKVESSSEDSSSDSESSDSDNGRKKSNKGRNLSRDKSTHTSEDKKSKVGKSKKDIKGKKGKAKTDLIDSAKSKIVKEVDKTEDMDNLKPKINLKQKIHYSLIDDEPIAMTESEMKILNAKNKLSLSKNVNPILTSTDFSSKNSTDKETKNKDFARTKRLKSKQESKTSDLDLHKNITGKPKLEDQSKKLRTETEEAKNNIIEYSPKKNKLDCLMHKGKSEDLLKNAQDTQVSLSKPKNEDIDKTENSKKNYLGDAVKSKSDEISAEVTHLKVKTEEENENKIEVSEKKANISIKGFMIKSKNSEFKVELPPTANSYDSDGQRSDTAMRNIFFGSQSPSNSPDPENESFTKSSYPLSKNDSNSSGESDSESDNEKTFFGISKDHVDNTNEANFKNESLEKVDDHSSDSNASSIDKNITDSDEDLTFENKQTIAVKQISNSTENTVLMNKKDFPFEKFSCSVKDNLKVENCDILNVECNRNSNVSSIKVPVGTTESVKESSLLLITSSDTTSVKGLSAYSKESSDKKNDLSDLSPRRTNSQDFFYDYGKSEIEDEKLDFDEDKSSESDLTVPSKIKEDIEVPNQKEKSDLIDLATKVNKEIDIGDIKTNKSVKNMQKDVSSSAMLSEMPVGVENIIIKEDVLSKPVVYLANEKQVSKEQIPETTCDQTFPSTQVPAPNSNNTVICNPLDIPVPSLDKLDDILIPFSSDEYKKKLSDNKSDNNVIMQSESRGLNKIDETAITNDNFLKKELVMTRTHDSSDDIRASPLPVEDNQKVNSSRVKSISRSRSRSKINKHSSKGGRSKSRSKRERSSSKRSKSKDKSISRRSKSKEKSSISRKGRSKSRDNRSHSKDRNSLSKERRKRSREKRSLSGSGRSRSKDKSSRLKERSRSRKRAISKSRRRTRSRDKSSRSRRQNRSRSRDKRSRSRDKRKRSRSHDKRSRSRGHRAHSRSRERSRSGRHRGRSLSSRDKRSRSRTRKERSQTNSKDRSESKDKKSKNDRVTSKIKLNSRSKSKSLEKKCIRSNSCDKKARFSSKQERSEFTSRSTSKEKNNETKLAEKLEANDNTILIVKSPIRSNSNVILEGKKAFSRSKSKENRSSEKEMETKTSSEKSPDRSSKEKSLSPLSFTKNSVPDPKIFRSRSNSISRLNVGSNSGNKKTKSPDSKLKRSRTKSPDTKPKRSRTKSPITKPKKSRTKSPDIKLKRSKTKSPDSKARRSRSKSRDKQKAKEKRAISKDRSKSKEVKNKGKARKSRSRERKSKTDEKSSKSQRKRSRTRSKSKEKNKSRDKRSRSRERRSKSRDKKSRRSRSRSRRRKNDKKDRSRRTRSRSKSRSRKRSKKSRSRSRSKDEFFIDKSKLLEIARKNALSMMKQGAVGTDLNKVTAITAGGKTVDELTDFCKLLSQKDATGQESVSSESSSDNESEKPFHHPFQLKERSNNIIMNIRNCASLPVKTHLEKTTENAQQLRLQFPVSSGQLHRKSENEWIPVSPKKTDELKAIMPAPLRKQEEELPVYPGLQETAHFSNIPLPNSIPHSQPHLPALPQVGNPWPKPHDSGLFTGTTGARFLSQAELASGQQAWAKKGEL